VELKRDMTHPNHQLGQKTDDRRPMEDGVDDKQGPKLKRKEYEEALRELQ
jgi:hypothetical protein